MPYLPDGTPIDIIFNPLGVPSRMNVGQVFECLLGLAGEKLGNRFKVLPFDEVYGKESSRILVNQKLKEAALKTDLKWLFNSYYPGKILLRDGRTGEFFDNPITVGKSYILKLIHLVEDKIHARATGPYSMITEQPLAGKSQKGGQRFGEMEVWALEAYGCSNTLQELLTIKSDDIDGRNDMYESILVRKEIEKPNPSIPESFLALIRELHALGLDFSIKKFENNFYNPTESKEIEKDLFTDLESRLKLRALLARKKAEQFAKSINFNDKDENFLSNKLKYKNDVIERLNKTNLKKL
jgi:DNA-directed RNA polymerase subunit beta